MHMMLPYPLPSVCFKQQMQKQLVNMNIDANKHVDAVRAELKLATDKLARTEAELAAMVGARRERNEKKAEKKEEKKKGGT